MAPFAFVKRGEAAQIKPTKQKKPHKMGKGRQGGVNGIREKKKNVSLSVAGKRQGGCSEHHPKR